MTTDKARRYTAEEIEFRAKAMQKAYPGSEAAEILEQAARTESDVQALVEALGRIAYPSNHTDKEHEDPRAVAHEALSKFRGDA